MTSYPESIEIIAEQLRTLPGVGKKSATRMAFGFVSMSQDEVDEFCRLISDSRKKMKICSVCGNISEDDVCPICSDSERDTDTLCVVEDIRSLISIERVDNFNGKYHVLGGTISPLEGRGPEDINLSSLPGRIDNEGIKEVIIATNPTTNGESTALYISKLLRNKNVKITRLGYGIPVGADLDYTDEKTLASAMSGRKELQ